MTTSDFENGRASPPPNSQRAAYHTRLTSQISQLCGGKSGSGATEASPLLGLEQDSKKILPTISWMYAIIFVFAVSLIATPFITFNAAKRKYSLDDSEVTRIRAEWEKEVIEHDDERLRMHLFWDNLSTVGCVRYKRRQYRARLMNVKPYYDHPIEACMKTPMPINGADKFPSRCEDRGVDGLYGIWEEDGEGYCATFFEQFQPMECTAWGSGLKRYRMRMGGLNPGDNWRDMCSSTPTRFLNENFDGPTYCDQQDGIIYGYWEIPDDYCVPY